jgi:four helix bundle protein
MEFEKKYLRLNDIESYKIAFHLSNYVWKIVIAWPVFAKDTIGRQFVRAIDSISANIAEGFGRFGKKEKTPFFHNFKSSQNLLTHSLSIPTTNWNDRIILP